MKVRSLARVRNSEPSEPGHLDHLDQKTNWHCDAALVASTPFSR